jgi:hypothetical protein
MASVTPSPRPLAEAARLPEREPATVPTPPAAPCPEHVEEGTLLAYVRMELLVARARSAR